MELRRLLCGAGRQLAVAGPGLVRGAELVGRPYAVTLQHFQIAEFPDALAKRGEGPPDLPGGLQGFELLLGDVIGRLPANRASIDSLASGSLLGHRAEGESGLSESVD